MIPSVSQTLTEMGIPHRVFKHAGPVKSLEQAAEERDQLPEQIIRSILFRISAEEFVMVLMAGPQQIDWKTLRRYLGEKRLSMANEAEMLRVTGYPRGAVSPFGLPQPVRILADESIFAHNEISIGSGVRGTTIIMACADLKQALGEIEVGQFGSRS
jgi:Cys-tRNA(Pro)/Cys-tRNA(Cys) deacylase